MSILWAEGFEQYGSGSDLLDGLWSEAQNVTLNEILDNVATGRKSARLDGVNPMRRSLMGDHDLAGVAFHVKISEMPGNLAHRYVFGLRNSAGDFGMCCKITPTGRIALFGQDDANLGSPIPAIATSRLAMTAGVYNHIEISFQYPEAKVYLNGKLAVSGNVPGEPIGPGGNPSGRKMGELFLGYRSTSSSLLFASNVWYDDIIAWEGETGPVGPSGVYYLRPVSDVAPQDWELTSGASAYALINELAPDDDSDYIFTGSVNDQSNFNVEALPANVAQVLAVIPIARVRKTDTGAADISLGVNSGGVQANGEDQSALVGYSYLFQVFENDPEDAQPWAATPMPQISIKRTL